MAQKWLVNPRRRISMNAMTLPSLTIFKNVSFNWVDLVLLVWLGIGLFRGRKNGMSEELLLVLRWLLIVVVGSLAYRPLGLLLKQYVPMAILWCYLSAYLITALLISSVVAKIKSAAGEKLVGSDVFGKGEYYFGMAAGVLRFLCMVIAVMALMNSRIYTKAELDASVRLQRKNFESINFPTYGHIQQDVLFKSMSGRLAREYLPDLLITSVPPEPKRPAETIGRREQRAIDEALGVRKP